MSLAILDHHAAVWAAIDKIAAERCVAVSVLARQAGLDPTTFNRSKRATARGPRWPSTETVARVLRATGRDWIDWARLVEAALPQPSIDRPSSGQRAA